jgi:DNA-binding protein
MDTTEKSEEKPVIVVGGKRTLEYVLDCVSSFNRGSQEAMLRSFEQGISKSAEVSQILAKNLGIQIISTDIKQYVRKGVSFTCAETTLKYTNSIGGDGDYTPDPESDFIEFPVYHLLLDSLLHQKKKLVIGKYDTDFGSRGGEKSSRSMTSLLTIATSNKGFRCTPAEDLLQIIGKKTGAEKEKRQRILGNLSASFCRCGLLMSPRWEEISQELSSYDDVILGVDTNILYNCSITQQLLDGFVLTSPKDHLHTPNWVLIVIPCAVMHEVEQAANSRDKGGGLNFEGRMGYRALQEIMELDQSKDLPGVSLLIVGEANPVLDTRVELQGLRADMKETAPQPVRFKLYRKLSAGDTIIRDQFKTFLRQISFHKGAFFITADKSNTALAQAEGLHSIYYPLPPWNTLLLLGQRIEPYSLEFESEDITLNVPFGKLVYELAVEFGEIWVSWGSETSRFNCDFKGDSLDHWVNRELQVNSKDLKKLIANYNSSGRFSLTKISTLWRDLGKNLMGWI